MTSNYPNALDDFTPSNAALTHAEVSDGLAAVQATLGVKPQGDAATVAERLSAGGRLLSGSGAPASGSGLAPLDGVSDPYRWSSTYGGWVSPIFEVTWVEGATLPIPALPTGAAELDVSVALGPTLSNAAGYSVTSSDSSPTVTTSAGSGIAFLFQYEADFGGPTNVADATLAVADYLGDGFIVGATYELPEVNTGVDGDSYRDTSAPAGRLVLYGPKAGGAWPAPQTFVSLDAPGAPIVIYSDNLGNGFRVVVADDGTLSTEPA